MVPVVDLTRRLARFQPAFAAACERVLKSGHLLLGAETEAFEAQFAAFSGHRHAIAVSSGAGALQLSLAGLGVGRGDEVVVPALTAVPTAAAVCAVGATPVLADVDLDTATLDPGSACAACTARTAAIVPVHLYGRAADLPECDAPIVEDAAQAHGAVPGPRRSAVVAYSFYPTKNLGGIGDGGAVCTDDDVLAATVRRMRVHGMTEQYVHVDISQNFRMAELEAAWLRIALDALDDDTRRRNAMARHYRASAPQLRWQADHPRHVHHLCVFRADDRERARAQLAAAGVGTAVHYPRTIAEQPAYAAFAAGARFPHAEAWARGCISVPCSPELTDAEVATVADALAGLAA